MDHCCFWLFLPSATALCLLSSCFFFSNDEIVQLSSPLLSLLPMMKLSNSRNYLEYELMIMNLWGTWHHYQPPLHYLLLSSLLWCIDALSSRSDDVWHVSEASTTATSRSFIYCCFIGLLWFIDLFDFLYLLAYLKHTFLHLLLLFSMSCQCWCCFVDPHLLVLLLLFFSSPVLCFYFYFFYSYPLLFLYYNCFSRHKFRRRYGQTPFAGSAK